MVEGGNRCFDFRREEESSFVIRLTDRHLAAGIKDSTMPRQQNLRPKCMSHGCANTGHRSIVVPRDWSIVGSTRSWKPATVSNPLNRS